MIYEDKFFDCVFIRNYYKRFLVYDFINDSKILEVDDVV